MKQSERRVLPRYCIHIPVRFRAIGLAGETAEGRTESLNLSRRGIYFATRFPLKVGMPILMWLRMPREVTGTGPIEARCYGRVVHARTGLYADGRICYGVEIEEFMSPAFAEKRAEKRAS